MTTKRKTKQQRGAEQKATLLRRITDVYSGALGEAWGENEFATADLLSRVLPALEQLLGGQRDYDWYWRPAHIGKFDNPQSATDFLFEHGFRA